MYAVSSAFKETVRTSHTVLTKAEVLRSGSVIRTLYPISGSVTIDARRAQRRDCALTLQAGEGDITSTPVYNTYAQLSAAYATYTALAAVATYAATSEILGYETTQEAADDLIPFDPDDDLTPYGNELRLYRGLSYTQSTDYTYAQLSGDYATYTALDAAIAEYGTLTAQQGPEETVEEYVPLGVFGITKVGVSTTTDGIRLDVSGVDRSKRITDNRWTEPYAIATGTNVGTALLALLQDRWADIETAFTTTSETTTAITLGLDTGNDPWADARKIATAAGLDLYFNGNGICILEPVPDYETTTPVETYSEGEDAMVLTANRDLSREGVYNAVIVTAEGSDTDQAYRGEALDDDSSSPTYVYGPFGRVTLFASSPLIKTQAAADRFAKTRLAKLKGRNESISWTQIVDPSLDANDVVTVSNAAARLSKTIVLDRLTIPLGASEPMQAVARTIASEEETA